MINRKMAVSALALVIAAGGANAQVTTNSNSAGVALLLPANTGFRYGADLGVTGVGSGAVTVTSTRAKHVFLGQALAGTEAPGLVTLGATLGDATTAAGVFSTFEFDRSVETSGSLAGIGVVMAEGEALGASGFAGAAFGNAERSGVETITAAAAPTVIPGGTLTKATDANSEAEAGVSGSLLTSNRLALVGTSANFAGSLGTEIGEENEMISFSRLISLAGEDVVIPAYNVSVALPASSARTDFLAPAAANNLGTALQQSSAITGSGGPDSIDLAIASAGGGSQSLSVGTGGFFTGGASAFGNNDFSSTFVAD